MSNGWRRVDNPCVGISGNRISDVYAGRARNSRSGRFDERVAAEKSHYRARSRAVSGGKWQRRDCWRKCAYVGGAEAMVKICIPSDKSSEKGSRRCEGAWQTRNRGGEGRARRGRAASGSQLLSRLGLPGAPRNAGGPRGGTQARGGDMCGYITCTTGK